MEDEYSTIALDDMIPIESPVVESQLLNLDMDTEVMSVCESAQLSGDQMEDYCHKEIVLDSDDEGGGLDEAVKLANGCSPRIGSFSDRDDEIGLRKRRQGSAGYFRRLDKKVRKHVFHHIDSARSDRCDEVSKAGRSCLNSNSRFREHLGVMDSVLSTSPDQKPIPTIAKEILIDPDCQNMVTECLAEDSVDERKLSSHDSKSINTEKETNYDCEHAQLNYGESPQTAESHDKALGFVEHYLSVSDLGSCKNIETRKTNRMISPPSLRSKGSQCLARRVNLVRNASTSTFDWTKMYNEKTEYTTLRMNEDSTFGFEGEKSEHLSYNQEAVYENLQNEISSLHSKEKLPGNIFCTNYLDTNSFNSNDLSKIGSNSITCGSVELDKQFNAGLPRHTVEEEILNLTSDALDIGLDTQIAAEAMEDLVHAAPPIFDPCLTLQGSNNALLDSLNIVNKKGKEKDVYHHEEAFVSWRCKEKRSRCMKMSTVQDKNAHCFAAKQFENQRKTVAPLPVNKKRMAAQVLNISDPGSSMNSKCSVPPGVTVQKEDYGLPVGDSLKEFQRLHCLYERRSKEASDGLKSNSHLKRRTKNRLHDDVCKVGVRDSSLEVKTDTSNREESINFDVADRTLSKLNPWIYPKGKRSHPCALPPSIRSNNWCSPCAAIDNNVDKYPVVNDVPHQKVAKLLVYYRRRKVSLERKQIGSSLELAGELSSSVDHNATSDKQVQISVECDTANPSRHCGKLDDEKCPTVDASNNMKSDVLTSDRAYENKQPVNYLSRSPLMKELTRLGYTESLPDFLPKDSRRRRAMEKVCVLFSHNLEASILKHQRKIVARLGFSVASCCSDATHFVTDRFVRTRNMLEAIAHGKHVVTHLWLESCEQAGYVIDESSYILRDEKKEKEIGFNMPASLNRASQHPLLKGHRVLITSNVKPSEDVISHLVKAVSGEVVPSIRNAQMKDVVIPNGLLILSCEEDYTICLPFLDKGASVYNSELLLNGIVTQKLEYERFQLFKDLA